MLDGAWVLVLCVVCGIFGALLGSYYTMKRYWR